MNLAQSPLLCVLLASTALGVRLSDQGQDPSAHYPLAPQHDLADVSLNATISTEDPTDFDLQTELDTACKAAYPDTDFARKYKGVWGCYSIKSLSVGTNVQCADLCGNDVSCVGQPTTAAAVDVSQMISEKLKVLVPKFCSGGLVEV